MERPANGAANADARLHDHIEHHHATKPCGICGAMTPRDQFSKRGKYKDGRQRYAKHCHACERERKRQARHADAESHRRQARRRYWANVTEQRRRGRERARSERGKEINRRAVLRYRERHPEKAHAHKLVRQALKAGTLIRPQTCQQPGCKVRQLHAHHFDYSQPIEVEWLCRQHHQERHRKPLDTELDSVAELPNSAELHPNSNKPLAKSKRNGHK